MHPRMSTIVPEVSGLGVAVTPHTLHVYQRLRTFGGQGRREGCGSLHGAGASDGQGDHGRRVLQRAAAQVTAGSTPQTLSAVVYAAAIEGETSALGHYCGLTCAERAEFVKQVTGKNSVLSLEVESLPDLFGQQISHDAHTIPHPCPAELLPLVSRAATHDNRLVRLGLNDALATWQCSGAKARERLRSRSRLIIHAECPQHGRLFMRGARNTPSCSITIEP